MNDYRNILSGDAAGAWKRLVGRFYWLNDSEIAKHLIEVHEQWCGDQCPLEKYLAQKSCDQKKSGLERSCDRSDVIPPVQSNEENKNISLQLEVDEGVESVDDDSSNDRYSDPASEEEDDIKQEPEFMDCTPQNGDSTYQKGDNLFSLSTREWTDSGGYRLSHATPVVKQEPTDNGDSTYQKGDDLLQLSTSKWTDLGGDHLSQLIPVIIQEPKDNSEYENSVKHSVETMQTKTISYDRTQLTSSGAMCHPVVSNSNVGDVKQEPTDNESAVTSERIVSYHHTPLVTSGVPASLSVMSSNIVTSSGAPALNSVMSTNTIASVNASVVKGIPSTKTAPQSVFRIIPGVNVAQTPAVQKPAVIGAQTLLPAPTSATQTINIPKNGNVVPSKCLNVVRRGNLFFLENAAPPSTRNLQNPSSNLPPTVPVAVNISNVGQGGSVPLRLRLVSGIQSSSSGKQVFTLSESRRGANGKQTDEGCKQMDKKDTQNSTANGQSLQKEHKSTDTGKKPSHFMRLWEEEDQCRSKAAKTRTRWGRKIFQDWSFDRYGRGVDFLTISAEHLSNQLERFYGEIQSNSDVSVGTKNKRKNRPKVEYNKNTIRNIRGAINHHLSDIGRQIDIVRDKEFKQANFALEGKFKQNMMKGLSKPTQHIPIISPNELSNISAYLMSGVSPVILRYRVWYDLSIYFVSCGLKFYQQLTTQSFLFLMDDNGCEYVTLSHETKQQNWQGGLENEKAPQVQRMYATGGDFCPVASLRSLLQHTDPQATSLFNHVSKEALKSPISTDVWYTTKPVKSYQFSQFMPEISQNSGCSRNYKAPSLRATAIQSLHVAGFQLCFAIYMSGHKHKSSIDKYSRDCYTALAKVARPSILPATNIR